MGEIETNNRAVTDWKQDRFWFLVCWLWFPDIGPLSQPKTGRAGDYGVRHANARRNLHERVLCFGSLQLPRQTRLRNREGPASALGLWHLNPFAFHHQRSPPCPHPVQTAITSTPPASPAARPPSAASSSASTITPPAPPPPPPGPFIRRAHV